MAVVIAATVFVFVFVPVEMDHVKEIAHSRHIRRHAGIPGIRYGLGITHKNTISFSDAGLFFSVGVDKTAQEKTKRGVLPTG